jgi:hypothetical protein
METGITFSEVYSARYNSPIPNVRLLIEIIGSFMLLSEISRLLTTVGYAVAQLVEALRSEPEGRGFDSRWCHMNFSLT